MQFGQIIKGHFNEIVQNEEELYNTRIAICNTCQLMEMTAFGKVCSSKKYLNQKTQTITSFPCPTCVNGCGCRLDAKTRVKEAKCPLNKWKNVND